MVELLFKLIKERYPHYFPKETEEVITVSKLVNDSESKAFNDRPYRRLYGLPLTDFEGFDLDIDFIPSGYILTLDFQSEATIKEMILYFS
ncbi:MAG: hypothetical protein DRG78_00395 [Epsilonproteobacteria bacterium]|nr:MAG: hypothetical protein DRG78_00395 [Campylobacterota bacterium]